MKKRKREKQNNKHEESVAVGHNKQSAEYAVEVTFVNSRVTRADPLFPLSTAGQWSSV
jgi:hypothetical protein